MSFIKNIPLRPHHGMCLAYFKGEGYSNRFSAHMQEMLDIFQKEAKIQLHADTDEICSACPNNEKGCCSSFSLATVYKGNIIKNLIMDCQSYTKYRPNETTGGIFVSWRRKEELPTGA